MISKQLRGISGVAALVLVTSLATDALACGTCGGATTAFYAPTAAYYQPAADSAAYAPAYTSYSGWYPGYWLNRISQNIWGSPTTYAVAYPSTYSVSYPATYAVSSVAPACSTCSTCSAAYAPCSSCAPAQTVTMRPICACSDYGSPCISCASGGCSPSSVGVVSQAVYQQSSGCSSCGESAVAVPSPGSTFTVPSGHEAVAPQSGVPTDSGPAPSLAPEAEVGARSVQKQETDSTGLPETVPGPADETPSAAPPENGDNGDPLDEALKGNDPNAGYFEAPRLHNPNDRAAHGVQAPVWRAIYEKPVLPRQVSTGRITAEQAKRDAAGWTSVSN
jgi:hypothetical protein